QELVAEIDRQLDLAAIWSKPVDDPVFAYHPPGTIEDLMKQWSRMVRVAYDSGTGIITVRALAFDPEDAQALARAIYAGSSKMINDLSNVAREDAIRFARQELDDAVARLKEARAAVTAFRNQNQLVDPAADITNQTGLLGTLQEQLAEA